MSFAGYSVLVFLISIVIFMRLKEHSLYLLFFVTFTQNFALAYLYTSGLAGKELCRSLILFKEFFLLELFVYSIIVLFRYFQESWPRPLIILIFFTAYCVLRFGIGALFLADFTADGLRKLRMMCFPVQIVTVTMAVSRLRPEFSRRLMRHLTCFLATLAVVGILLFLLPQADFWKQHVDIAAYNVDVKGEDPSTVIEEQGISGTGAGREAFLFLSAFRAMGTFADPLSFGFAMAMPILLLTFHYERSWLNILMLALSGVAIFFTFSRSSWIFVTISFMYILIRRRKYRLIFSLAALGTFALLSWPPLAKFAASDLAYMSWANPGIEHAEGIVWFYQRAFTDPGNILGKGMDDSVQKVPESGYAFLLEHFGLVAYASFILFCFSLFSYLRKRQGRPNSLILIGQAIPICVLIVMHTSQYPFAFSEYLFIWFVVGVCVSPISTAEGLSHETQQLPA